MQTCVPLRVQYNMGTEKTIERTPVFVRRGGNCCRGDLVGETNWFLFSVVCKSYSNRL